MKDMFGAELPETIHSPKTFKESQFTIQCTNCKQIIGFDGVFAWDWIQKAIRRVNPSSNIRPMDFDGVVERNFHYLVFETKGPGGHLSQAQEWTLSRLTRAKSFTAIKCGKNSPGDFEIWYADGRSETGSGMEDALMAVETWYRMADRDEIKAEAFMTKRILRP